LVQYRKALAADFFSIALSKLRQMPHFSAGLSLYLWRSRA